MILNRIFTRSALALAVLTLAACQTAPVQQDTASAPADTSVAPAATPGATQPPTQAAAEQGAPVAVFLADMSQQAGWREIPVGTDSVLYINPQPIVVREDLTGVQAGANQQGQGLLALMLSEDARTRLEGITTNNPNKRLALVVGSTLMSAPGYAEPVNSGQLIFPVGTEANATAAARAIAGVDASGAALPPAAPAAMPQ